MKILPFNKPIKKLLFTTTILFLLLAKIIILSIFSLNFSKPAGLMPVNNSDGLAINNVNIVMVKENRILNNRQLVIQNGRITAINKANSSVRSNIREIDGNNTYVTPGLFDMHVHIYDRKYLTLNLAYGVTSVRNLNGMNMHLRWREELKNKEWLGSNLYLSSPILAGKGSHALNQKILSPQQGRDAVHIAKASGYDFIKVYGYLEPKIFEAIIDEAKIIDIRVAKHGPHPARGSDWSYLEGLQSLEHVEDIFQGPLNYEYNKEALEIIARKIKQSNVPVVPTLATFDHLTQLSNGKDKFINSLELDYLNPLYFDIQSHFTVSRWLKDNKKQSTYHLEKQKFLSYIVKVLHENKVKILVGSDAGTMYSLPGLSTHNEMKLLQQSGVSNFEILKAATINAAQTLSIEQDYGSIEIGKIADLVLVTENPLDEIKALRTPYAVVKSGQWLDKKQLKRLRIEAKNTDSYYWSIINLLEDLLIRFFIY
ncbi:amidohydrolase family protein [Algibacillus agarilyticus]|uniref:amidohydrolase family protein n=1 Tax=Algibacillus agarilyticus TaxID=2234133 RepID=UPI000DD09A4F|nr:amidohydrolase family protein [Algibacillus agarilyticus]